MIAWTIYLTFIGAIGRARFCRGILARWIALLRRRVGLAIALFAFFAQRPAQFRRSCSLPWVPALGMEFHLAVDGISLTLVLVTAITAI